jgi:hypothetical protein
MNYQQPWQQLDIDISNAIRKDFDFADLLAKSQFAGQPAGLWHFKNDDVDKILDPQWMTAIHDQGIPVKNAMVFYREPFYIHPEAHIDVRWNNTPCIAAINWTLDLLDDSEMVWYNEPPVPSEMVYLNRQPSEIDTTPAATKYLSWPLHEIKPYWVACKTIGTVPTLVRTGTPHNIIMRSRPRWAISVRYEDKHLSNWQETVDFFKPWIKDADC